MLRFSLLAVASFGPALFVCALACGDDAPTTGSCPPEDVPVTTDDCVPVCNANGTWTTQCCGDPPEPPGCGTFTCLGGTWQLDSGSCFACPSSKPAIGERCEEGARCDYPTTCGHPDQLDCVGRRFQLVKPGCCDPGADAGTC
jgi:hypothetical protein